MLTKIIIIKLIIVFNIKLNKIRLIYEDNLIKIWLQNFTIFLFWRVKSKICKYNMHKYFIP